MKPEEKARVKIDKQLKDAGWDIVTRNDYVPFYSVAVKEALMQGNTESDYLLFIDNKAIAVVEAKRESNELNEIVAEQAEDYAQNPQPWYGLWCSNQQLVPLVYLANGNKIYYKNMLIPDSEYEEISFMHSPKKMLQIIGAKSTYGALPRLNNDDQGLRDCQYKAVLQLENSLKNGKKKSLAVLATGSGKTYLACLASYRLLNYTSTKRILFLVDRNNLARQTESEFSTFERTEDQQTLSNLYSIKRLKKKEDVKADVVISTIQKLFAVLTGQTINDVSEDEEDEENTNANDTSNEIIKLTGDLMLPPDYFQFIIVDECHRSIYGKWKAVLDYFKDASVLGLTATPTEEAYAYFNKNIIEKYTYEDSVVDGVNVPARIYRIGTRSTIHGGTIESGSVVNDTAKSNGNSGSMIVGTRIDYSPTALDKSITNLNQIETILAEYRDIIYKDLYPDRDENWYSIPKTLIFAKNDNHASEIVDIIKKVFSEKFENNSVPENFVKKITYSAGDSNELIREFRTEKEFRIAVTVTLVATGTDVRSLEVVLFMNDVKSDILYTQMKGRGCRTINDDKLKEITQNAETKECFYIVDAVGVTEHEKKIPSSSKGTRGQATPPLDKLLEWISHGEVSDSNLILLRDYCSTINNRYSNNLLFGRHLDEFIIEFGFAPKYLAERINKAIYENSLPPFVDASQDNSVRMSLVSCLIGNLAARNKLLELKKGYMAYTDEVDEVIFSGFSKETARTFIDNFEKCIFENKDSIEALRIIYNSENCEITHSMLVDLRDKLINFNRQYTPYYVWRNYKLVDNDNSVDELDVKNNVNALTNLIQIIRYVYGKINRLYSLYGSFAQRFNLYCGQAQRVLTDEQKEVMRQIATYIVDEGAITLIELNEIDTDLWRRGVTAFSADVLSIEIGKLTNMILKVA